MENKSHPGSKLVEQGAPALYSEEVFAILIGTGCKDRTAEDISKELFDNFCSVYGFLGKTASDISNLNIKGLKNGKIKRIAAAFEMAKRMIRENKWDHLPVEKVKLGLPDLSDAQVLAVLIATKYKDKSPKTLAEELLKRYKSFNGFAGKTLYDAAQIEGLGDVKIIRIAAAYDVAWRVIEVLQREAE